MPAPAPDRYEHPYHLDYGAKTSDFVEAFMRNIHWITACKQWKNIF